MMVIAAVEEKKEGGSGKWYPGYSSNVCSGNGSGGGWQWNRRSSHQTHCPRGGGEPHLAGYVYEEWEAVELDTVLHTRPGYRAKRAGERVCRRPGDTYDDCLRGE